VWGTTLERGEFGGGPKYTRSSIELELKSMQGRKNQRLPKGLNMANVFSACIEPHI
jgi:hypothetical protein